MRTVNFTEFRRNASEFFSEVEHGEVLLITRHGKPIAEVLPVSQAPELARWKQPGLRLSIKGEGLSSAIIRERGDEDVL